MEEPIFDCSDYKQGNQHVSTVNQICEYLSTNYKQDSNIKLNIERDKIFKIPKLEYLIDDHDGDESNITRFIQLTFNHKNREHVKQKNIATKEI